MGIVELIIRLILTMLKILLNSTNNPKTMEVKQLSKPQ